MSLKLLNDSISIVENSLNNQGKHERKQETKSQMRKEINKNTFKSQPKKVNLQLIRDELKQNDRKAEINMKRLLALSKNTIKIEDAKKIVKSIHKTPKDPVPKVTQESIFTEEDFEAFEREYFIT